MQAFGKHTNIIVNMIMSEGNGASIKISVNITNIPFELIFV